MEAVAGVKEAPEVKSEIAESTGSEVSKSNPQKQTHKQQQQESQHKKGDGNGETPAKAVTREREAGWGDYFRYVFQAGTDERKRLSAAPVFEF